MPGSSHSRLPDFFVIGAMKAGTTTLYHDLRRQPGIRMPDKESNGLVSESPVEVFHRLLPPAEPGASAGEVCPDYTKPGSGEKAAAVAESLYRERPLPKIIYLVREPIARLRSHHHFLSSQQGQANPDGMTADIESSIRDFPELIETSRYASRLQPWIDAFGENNVRVIRFEDYIAARTETIREIFSFLGLPPGRVEPITEAGPFNPSASRPVATPGWHRIRRNPLYRKLVRPLLSLETRDRIRSRILPIPPPPPDPPSDETLALLKTAFQSEVEGISRIAGASKSLWDLDEAVESIRSSR